VEDELIESKIKLREYEKQIEAEKISLNDKIQELNGKLETCTQLYKIEKGFVAKWQ
jgi:hypothetical protein